MRERRLQGSAHDAIVDELVASAQKVFPRAVVQFEDFSNDNAFRLLERHRGSGCVFNDDIQGTGARSFPDPAAPLMWIKGPSWRDGHNLWTMEVVFSEGSSCGSVVQTLANRRLRASEASHCARPDILRLHAKRAA